MHPATHVRNMQHLSILIRSGMVDYCVILGNLTAIEIRSKFWNLSYE